MAGTRYSHRARRQDARIIRRRAFSPPERRINVIKDSASGFNKLKAGNRRTRSSERPLERGYFVKPTVFVGVNNKMRIAQKEIFGLVAALIPLV